MEKFNSLLKSSKLTNENLEQALFSIGQLSLADSEALNKFSIENSNKFLLTLKTDYGDEFILPCVDREQLEKPIDLLIKKHNSPHSVYFFSLQGFENGLAHTTIDTRKTIFINDEFEEFCSRTCEFKRWQDDKDTYLAEEKNIDVRKLVKDASAGELTKNIEFWITNKAPPVKSDVYAVWLRKSVSKSSLIFCSEIWKEDSTLKLIVSGTKKLETTFNVKDNPPASINETNIYEAANWVLDLDREVEIRHQLLSARLSSQQLKKNEGWLSFLSRTLSKCLENSKNDYKAHVHSKTSDTLKAIADIRKIIAEESSKVIDRTHALSAVLFRDIAIAFSAIGIRIISIPGQNSLENEKIILLILSACWLATSLKITTKTNYLYIKSLTKSRFSWSRKVNTTIPISEFKELSEKPFKDAVNAYNQIRKLAEHTYFLSIFLLLFFAFYKPIFNFIALVFSATC
ncbi:hypothetical protein [Pseudomonas mandelii]|uniref:hypothetical protein n=1 Tax=Pseudomonas mandelii TaxID=75612 RepID=UPI00112BB4CD|nr:hypothetical protein [Pseudomonas mandelii]